MNAADGSLARLRVRVDRGSSPRRSRPAGQPIAPASAAPRATEPSTARAPRR